MRMPCGIKAPIVLHDDNLMQRIEVPRGHRWRQWAQTGAGSAARCVLALEVDGLYGCVACANACIALQVEKLHKCNARDRHASH